MPSKLIWALLAMVAVVAGIGAGYVKTRNDRLWAEQAATLEKGRDYEERRAARLEAEAAANKPPTVEQIIAQKKIAVGFTPDQVRRAWGNPKSSSVSDGVGHRQEFFHYESTTVYFIDNRLVRWTENR